MDDRIGEIGASVCKIKRTNVFFVSSAIWKFSLVDKIWSPVCEIYEKTFQFEKLSEPPEKTVILKTEAWQTFLKTERWKKFIFLIVLFD